MSGGEMVNRILRFCRPSNPKTIDRVKPLTEQEKYQRALYDAWIDSCAADGCPRHSWDEFKRIFRKQFDGPDGPGAA